MGCWVEKDAQVRELGHPFGHRVGQGQPALLDQGHGGDGHRLRHRGNAERIPLHRLSRDVAIAQFVDLQTRPDCQTRVTAPASRPASMASRMEVWLSWRLTAPRVVTGAASCDIACNRLCANGITGEELAWGLMGARTE